MKNFLYLAFFLSSISGNAQVQVQEINTGWKFRKAGDIHWSAATVPGTVHTDLLANKLIPDPLMGTNEKDVQWIDTVDWEYETTFAKSNKPGATSLLFEGLDTYAAVYLNDSLILQADNMFRSWEVDVTTLLRSSNTLRIYFTSAVNKGKAAAKQLPYTLPGDEKVFTRKAAYHYGWDWGPRFVTSGIWKSVKLLTQTGSLRVLNHYIIQDNIKSETATLRVQSLVKQNTNARVRVYDAGTNTLLGQVETKGSVIITPIVIKNPKLWWCNGHGEPHLYTLSIETENIDTKEKVTDTIRIGLRTVELVQEADSIGKSFYFKLNGKPIFAKGANYIPPDNFLPRATLEKYKSIVQTAQQANMNMLRVWGGGVYPDDAFYQACDEMGILVWQDFMFACSMYPGDSHFLENVKAEAEEQITRLRNHASLALWCGNNEVSEAWHNWGWQKLYKHSKTDSTKIWNDYLTVFEKILPEAVRKLDASHNYWPSSPQYGWGRKQSMTHGDSHYWGVWWGRQPFDFYNTKVPRFMSEYGFEGMPSKYLYEQLLPNEQPSLRSTVVKHHQKHPIGFETIDEYMKREYNTPSEFDNYRYISQLVQADGMKIAIEAHRRNQPYCMGTLYWQLNDCWPVTSWSSVDSYGIPKAAHYHIAKAFEPTIVSVMYEKSKYNVYTINEQPINLDLVATLQSFEGKILKRETKKISFKEPGGHLSLSLDSAALLKGIDRSNAFLFVELVPDKRVVYSTTHFFTEVKNLAFQKPLITYSIDDRTKTIILKTNTLAKNVYLEAGPETSFKHNYFDLLPNQEMRVNFTTSLPVSELQKRLVIKSVYDTYPH